jgi:nitrite reductase (NADH) small subunit
VLSRGIVGDIKGEPVVASPIYKHHFSLRNGRCLEKPSLGVPVYRVRVQDGQVQVLPAPY